MDIAIKFNPLNQEDIAQLKKLAHVLSDDVVSTPAPTAPIPTAPAESLDDIVGEAPNWMNHDVDADGIKWDDRIHASTKRKNSDGTWTRKRGVSQDLVDAVVAELKGQPDLPHMVFAAPNVAHVDTPPVVVPLAPIAPPLPPVATPAPAPTAAAVPVSQHTIEELNNEVTSRVLMGELAFTDLSTVLAKHGLVKITDLAVRPDLVDAVWADLDL